MVVSSAIQWMPVTGPFRVPKSDGLDRSNAMYVRSKAICVAPDVKMSVCTSESIISGHVFEKICANRDSRPSWSGTGG
jgi:hypothetical protein